MLDRDEATVAAVTVPLASDGWRVEGMAALETPERLPAPPPMR
ncbi:hypothetical protein [Novosphingobium sp. PC22D]|nr:hypothetical protein [Novosphingobium sp. PC22D]